MCRRETLLVILGLTALLSVLLFCWDKECKPQGGERQMAQFQIVVVLNQGYVLHH